MGYPTSVMQLSSHALSLQYGIHLTDQRDRRTDPHSGVLFVDRVTKTFRANESQTGLEKYAFLNN